MTTLAVAEIGGTAVKLGFARDGAPLEASRSYPTARIRTGDPAAALAALVREAGRAAGVAASVLFSPRIVLIGGGLPAMDGFPAATLDQRLRACLPAPYRRSPPEIRRARLGWRAAIHGAIGLAP